ncbi:MFS transporter, putative [Talaromyces stipitatus ATCC 10500]|uniref:MFS transporter, putative n=1 Tax=Talaromyces stipitatus (strain ATCC 10500 / CBS 375.48 / QM 6759 / NRRL 1006) TaxID=441959 RepID=B8M1J5_TALSN|nr:MFS transporter, putative [Talaromyces stipitatus ATCC 10500]EED22082.1 MFS transporter, putative [Talaromyces stipitatus ATCC 10500]
MATAGEHNNIEEVTTSYPDAEKPEDMQIEHDAELGPIAPAIDPVIEKRVVRKLDRRLPVLTGFMFLLSYLDRSNIGNAQIAGMKKDLHLDGGKYAWLLTIFYISYTLFEFQALMWKVLKPHQWAAFTMLAWGVIATCQSATTSWGGMMACRFLLGAAEAGFGPGIPYLLSFFYSRRELGFRCGLFLSCAPLAATFAGALAYGITSGHPHIANWRLLFLVEGLPTILFVPFAYFLLPDSPGEAKFLTEEERAVAKARSLRRSGEEVTTHKIDWKDIGLTLLDPKPWFTALMYFSCNVSYSSLPVFLPTILEDMGYSSVNAQGLEAPPFFLAFLVTIFSTWVADRLEQRGLVIAVLSTIGAVGYVIVAAAEPVGVRYFGVFLAASGVFPAIGNILSWVLNNQGSDTRRGMAMVMLNLIGQCGPFLGTNSFPSTDSPRYARGLWICAAFMFFNLFLCLCLRTLLAYENQKLDRQYGTKQERQANQKADFVVAEENYGEDFRYML